MKLLLLVCGILIFGNSGGSASSPYTPPDTRPPGQESQTSKTIRKLEKVGIPIIKLNDAKLDVVCTFLTEISEDYDPHGEGIVFLFDSSGFDIAPAVTMKLEDKPLIYILESLTQKLPISYAVMDNYIILRKANKAVDPILSLRSFLGHR